MNPSVIHQNLLSALLRAIRWLTASTKKQNLIKYQIQAEWIFRERKFFKTKLRTYMYTETKTKNCCECTVNAFAYQPIWCSDTNWLKPQARRTTNKNRYKRPKTWSARVREWTKVWFSTATTTTTMTTAIAKMIWINLYEREAQCAQAEPITLLPMYAEFFCAVLCCSAAAEFRFVLFRPLRCTVLC